jgi:hypothetical protein
MAGAGMQFLSALSYGCDVDETRLRTIVLLRDATVMDAALRLMVTFMQENTPGDKNVIQCI